MHLSPTTQWRPALVVDRDGLDRPWRDLKVERDVARAAVAEFRHRLQMAWDRIAKQVEAVVRWCRDVAASAVQVWWPVLRGLNTGQRTQLRRAHLRQLHVAYSRRRGYGHR